jgi:hypothetical protein
MESEAERVGRESYEKMMRQFAHETVEEDRRIRANDAERLHRLESGPNWGLRILLVIAFLIVVYVMHWY